MCQQRVCHGQRRIYTIQRWSPTSARKLEVLLLVQNQLIQHTEIACRSFALNATKRVQILHGKDRLQLCLKIRGSLSKLRHIHAKRMITQGSFQNPASIVHLAKNHIARHKAAPLWMI